MNKFVEVVYASPVVVLNLIQDPVLETQKKAGSLPTQGRRSGWYFVGCFVVAIYASPVVVLNLIQDPVLKNL